MTNFGLFVSIILILILGAVVLRRGNDQKVKFIFLGATLSLVFFQTAHLLGINAIDPARSRFFLMGTTATFLLIAFTNHLVYLITGESRKYRFFISSVYSFALIFLLYFNFFPDQYLRLSAPKLYLPNYYEPGPLYFVIILFVVVVVTIFILHLIAVYRRSVDPLLKNRLKYFIFGTTTSYLFGSLAFPLVYNISVDPIFVIFAGFYTIPFAYGIIRYQMMEIEIVAKKALIYGLIVSFTGLFLTSVNYLDRLITARYQGFPGWLIPVLMATTVVFVGVLVWNKIREADALKYEFITVVTHKFRTPLTYIKWALESLLKARTDDERRSAALKINQATEKMVLLTESLVGLANSGSSEYLYRFSRVSLPSLVTEVVQSFNSQIMDKKLDLRVSWPDDLPAVTADQNKLQSVIYTVIENAVLYSKVGGQIVIGASAGKGTVTLFVKDNGIGLEKSELNHVFEKFFRGQRARRVDTEGLGVGLYAAKTIMDRLGGRIEVASAGAGQGAEFKIILPIFKDKR